MFLVGASVATALPVRARVGTAPRLPDGARGLGAAPADLPLHLTVALEPRDPAALESLATAVSTPGSPAYREYLSVPEFARRFGPAPAQVEAVAEALRDDGLEVGAVTADHLTMAVSGSADQVERAFASPLAEVRLAGGRTAYVNQAPPTLPTPVARYVQGVVGLDDLALPHPQVTAAPAASASPQVVTGGPQPCPEAQDAAGFNGLTADEIAAAYQFSGLYGSGDLGAGQTVAMVELQPYSPSDIAFYQSCYGTSASVTPVDVDGGPEPSHDDSEAALDIEQVIGLAPQASVLVYQAPNDRPSAQADVIAAIVSENRAKVISSSWAICEPIAIPALTTLENTLLQEAAVQGQSFFAATGDTGSAGCLRNDPNEEEIAIQDPSSQPFATAVGGTSLVSTGPPPGETVWNDGSAEAGATGGGASIQWPMPSYQAGASPALGLVSAYSQHCAPTYCRQVPDVAADSDPLTGYVIHANEEWMVVAGTSAAAPLWAALAALADADPACRGRTIGFANPALYAIAGAGYAANFHDVTAASPFSDLATNDVFSGDGPYPVTPGYDMTTGLGTPVASTLAASLCAVASPVYTVSLANPGTVRSRTKRAVSLQISGSDSGGLGLAYSAAGLPPGLAINPGTGAITGVPTHVGVWTVTVSASDAFTNSGTTQFSWGIARRKTARVSHLKLRGVAARRPRLSFKVAVGKSSPRLRAIKVTLPRGLGLSRAKRPLYAGVKVLAKHGKHGRVRLRVRHGALLIDLPRPAPKAMVRLRWPALRASAKLAARVAGHKKKKVKVKVVIGVTDAAGHGSRFAVSTRAR